MTQLMLLVFGVAAVAMLAVGVALVGQKVGGPFPLPTHSGAVGALLVVPFAMLGTSVAAIFSIALGTLVGWGVLETIRTRLRR